MTLALKYLASFRHNSKYTSQILAVVRTLQTSSMTSLISLQLMHTKWLFDIYVGVTYLNSCAFNLRSKPEQRPEISGMQTTLCTVKQLEKTIWMHRQTGLTFSVWHMHSFSDKNAQGCCLQDIDSGTNCDTDAHPWTAGGLRAGLRWLGPTHS